MKYRIQRNNDNTYSLIVVAKKEELMPIEEFVKILIEESKEFDKKSRTTKDL